MLNVMGMKIDNLEKGLNRFEQKMKQKESKISELETMLNKPEHKDALTNAANIVQDECNKLEIRNMKPGAQEEHALNKILLQEVEMFQNGDLDVAESVSSLSSTMLNDLYRKAEKANISPSPPKTFIRKYPSRSKRSIKVEQSTKQKPKEEMKSKAKPKIAETKKSVESMVMPARKASQYKAKDSKVNAVAKVKHENKLYEELEKGFVQMDNILNSAKI